MSKLFYRTGSMNSGKSTNLLQVAYNYEERDQHILLAKPSTDTKHEHVLSRLGASRAVDINVDPKMDLFREFSDHLDESKKRGLTIDCLLVDEAQFLTESQVNGLFNIAVLLNVPVIAYGIRTDFRTHFFEGSRRLMEIAHSIEELKTICRCGRKAMFNARKINGVFISEGDQVAIDGQEAEYESLCGACYIKLVGPVV